MAKKPAWTEAVLQEHVIDLAHVLGWEHMHVRRSIGKHGRWVTATNVPWPDLTLWSPRHNHFMVRELKVRNVFQPGQLEVLKALLDSGVDAKVWTPADWEDDTILRELRHPKENP